VGRAGAAQSAVSPGARLSGALVLPTIQGAQRDTAWFSILDSEGPAIKSAFERWLAPENFNAEGRQWMRLSELTAEAHRS
jgi:hypothetical protein